MNADQVQDVLTAQQILSGTDSLADRIAALLDWKNGSGTAPEPVKVAPVKATRSTGAKAKAKPEPEPEPDDDSDDDPGF